MLPQKRRRQSVVLEKVFRVSNRQPRISMAARATRLRSRPRSTTLSSSLRHLDTSMHLLLDATILYFIRNGNKKTAKCPLRGSRGGRGRFFFYLGSRTYLKSKCKWGPASGIRHGVRGLGLGLVRRSALLAVRGNSRKNEVALETPNTPKSSGSLLA